MIHEPENPVHESSAKTPFISDQLLYAADVSPINTGEDSRPAVYGQTLRAG
jgi:hypothetical protein